MPDPDYCELCDLPLSQCVHGQPKPVAAPPPEKRAPEKRAPARRTTPAARPRTPGAPAAPARTAPRRWTAPDELRLPILAVLHEAGGELDTDDMFAALEERVAEALRPGDRETNPQGELRWRAAARKARKALMDEGVLATAGPGVWRLA